MKIFVTIASLLTMTQAQPWAREQPNVVCPQSVDVDGNSVFVPHPTDCGLYYQCVGLQPVLMSCPPGLWWDTSLNVCNWPEAVDCNPATQAPETTEAEEETTTEAEEETTTEVEEETTTEAEEETTTEAEEEACAEGWESFQGQCYKYFKSWKSWSEARASCQAAGGDLASAGDEATNDFLSGLTSFRAWIGGRRVATASREWIWTDGTTWGFENWSWGNPNNFIAQNSLVINYGRRGQWNDDMGYKKMAFICQY